MTDRLQRPRRLSRLLAAALATGALLASALVAPPPAHAELPPEPVAGVDQNHWDQSEELPRTRRNEIVGDFLNLGYDQRAVVEEHAGKLVIYDAPSRGGGVLRSTDTDLHDAPSAIGSQKLWMTRSSNVNADQYQNISNVFDLPTVYLAKTAKHLYIAGAWGKNDWVGEDNPDPESTAHQSYVYEVPLDGSCAKRACASRVLRLEPVWANIRLTAVTALDTTTARDGSTILAVGQTDNGVRLYRVSDGGGFEFLSQFNGMSTWGGEQIPIVSLAFSPAPSTTLAVGAMSWGNTVAHVGIQADGSASSNYTLWTDQPGASVWPPPLAMEMAFNEKGELRTAVGRANGTVKLLDPTVTGNEDAIVASHDFDGAVLGVTFINRVDGGGQAAPDIAVAREHEEKALVLRYDGSSSLKPQPIGGRKSTTTDLAGLRNWFPGYKAGRFLVDNSADEPVTMQLQTRPDSGYGCWYGPAFTDGTAFPDNGIFLNTGMTPQVHYSLGGLTAGADGGCGSSDFVGQWAAYLTTTPVRRPADATVSKITMTASGELKVTSVGGSLSVQASRFKTTHALGDWVLRVVGPRQPVPLGITGRPADRPTMVGKRLDPAPPAPAAGRVSDRPVGEQPVYRFDVAPTRWSLPPVDTRGSTRVQAVMPVMTVQGTTDMRNWTDLGRLVPNGAPTRTSQTLTLGKASFYWQNPSAGPQIQAVRVSGPNRAMESLPIKLADLKQPAASKFVNSVNICSTNGKGTCDDAATPAPNGLDQESLKVQIYTSDDGGVTQTILPSTDPSYDRVYYRYDDGTLVTNLFPLDESDPSTMVGPVVVSPWIGAYTDGGKQTVPSARPGPTVGGGIAYLSTTSLSLVQITGHVGGSIQVSAAIEVTGSDIAPTVRAGYKTDSGIYVTGCSDFENSGCRLAVPTVAAPALFITNDPITGVLLVGAQFKTEARSSQSSLPLLQETATVERTVAAVPLTVNSQDATMGTTTKFLPKDTIDTTLISHGWSVAATSVEVGGGN